MLIGGGFFLFGTSWTAFVSGRLLSGIGGVIINVVMTKMVVDWFAGREISTAIAVFITSWPVGIAVALLILPIAAGWGGLSLAWITVQSVVLLGLSLFFLFYHPPPKAVQTSPRLKTAHLPWLALFLVGVIWALYNTALAMIFTFGAAALSQNGWSLVAASSVISLFMVIFSISAPLGGMLADRTGRRDTVIVVSLLSYVIGLPLILISPGWLVLPIIIVLAIVFAWAAGPIVSLPSEILRTEARAFGMGVYYAIYYAIMMVAPSMVGALAERSGDLNIAFLLGAGVLGVCILALITYRRIQPALGAPIRTR
jgi:MFS family permease